MADRVPKGIDLRGFFKSPESPTPAVIPVNAGKIIAKTLKKLSGFAMWANGLMDGSAEMGLPIKKATSDTPKMLTTTHNTVTPKLAPFLTITSSNRKVAGTLIIRTSGVMPVAFLNQSKSGVNAWEKAII